MSLSLAELSWAAVASPTPLLRGVPLRVCVCAATIVGYGDDEEGLVAVAAAVLLAVAIAPGRGVVAAAVLLAAVAAGVAVAVELVFHVVLGWCHGRILTDGS